MTHPSQVLLSDSGKAICEHLGHSHPQALSAYVGQLPLQWAGSKDQTIWGLPTKYELNIIVTRKYTANICKWRSKDIEESVCKDLGCCD